MSKVIIAVFFIFISLVCFSQEKKDSSSVKEKRKPDASYFSELVIGMAIPMGDFAGTDTQNSRSGFARTGGFLFAGYGKLYNDRIGFEVAVSVNVYPLKEEIDQLKKMENADYYEHGFGWWTISGLIGPYFSLPVKNFSFNFRALAGVMDVIRPYFRNLDDTGAAKLEESTGNGYAFTWQIGAGIKYRLSDKVGLKLSMDYLGATPNINYQETFSAYQVYYHKEEINYKQPVSSFNSGLGLIFHLH